MHGKGGDKMIRSKDDKIFEIVCIVLASLFMLVCLYPLLYSLGISLCGEAEWTEKNGLILLFPSSPTFLAYRKIFGVGSYVLKALWMSLLRTVVGTLTSVSINALVGYALSRGKFPGKDKYIYLLLFTIFFSGGLIPNYLVIKELNLLNNFWALILPNIVSAWNILIFKQFFLGIPAEIQEAATVDGIGEMRLFTSIILPLSTPVVASIGLFTMVAHWNNWFDVMIYIDQAHSALWTLQYYIMINFNIEPNWYYQNASQKTSTAGKIGIEWYTGELSETTQAYYTRNNIIDPATGEVYNTKDWWETYPVPKDPASPYGGYQPSDGFLGTIITVSVKAANDAEKMQKIIKFLDDLAMTKTENADGTVTYNRSKAYDALRWGVGIEDSLNFQTIENSSQVYIYTGDEAEGTERSYRSQYPGAWDWGMFFRSTDDGVVQGTTSPVVTSIVNKVIEHDSTTAGYKRRLQYGSVLKLDSSVISTLTKKMQEFEYKYVNDKNKTAAAAQKMYDDFVADWKKSGGTELLKEAEKQFRSYGWIK